MPLTRRKFLLTSAALASAAPSSAKVDANALHERIAEIQRKQKLPGLAVSVFSRRAERFRYFAGTRALGGEDPVKLTDAWHLGSLTKSMTATLAALAVADGKLKWGQALGDFFPKAHESQKNTSVLRLMGHTAGFSHTGPKKLWNQLRAQDGLPAEVRAWWVEAMVEQPVEKKVGEFTYSNAGYTVLGHVLEKIYSQTWETQIQQRIAVPLGIKKLGFGHTPELWAHRETKPILHGPFADNPLAMGPAGTAHLPLEDWLRYARWHLSRGNTGKLRLPENQLAVLHKSDSTAKESYAGGWFVVPRPRAKGLCLTHSGSNTMHYALVWLVPESDLGFTILTNRGGEGMAAVCEQIAVSMVQSVARK
jgi:CubicO group peptidase (beta-lactamase class C family)